MKSGQTHMHMMFAIIYLFVYLFMMLMLPLMLLLIFINVITVVLNSVLFAASNLSNLRKYAICCPEIVNFRESKQLKNKTD